MIDVKEELEALYRIAKDEGDVHLALAIIKELRKLDGTWLLNTCQNPIHLKDAIGGQAAPEGYIWDAVGNAKDKKA